MAENVYIVDAGAGKAVIVDPGAEPERIAAALGSRKPLCVALTHGHLDHVCGLPGLLELLGPVPVAVHSADARYLGARSRETNLRVFDDIGHRMFFETYWTPMPEADILLEDGDLLPGTDFVTIHTPGHTAGSCCFYIESEEALLSGDTLFQFGIGRTDGFDGSPEAIEKSILERLMTLPSHTRVYPGHGAATTIAAECGFFS